MKREREEDFLIGPMADKDQATFFFLSFVKTEIFFSRTKEVDDPEYFVNNLSRFHNGWCYSQGVHNAHNYADFLKVVFLQWSHSNRQSLLIFPAVRDQVYKSQFKLYKTWFVKPFPQSLHAPPVNNHQKQLPSTSFFSPSRQFKTSACKVAGCTQQEMSLWSEERKRKRERMCQ